MKALDLTNRQFGRWTAIALASHGKKRMWLCQCECGSRSLVSTNQLTGGLSKSCGCLKSEILKRIKTKHGMSDSNEYRIWFGMLQRCNNRKNVGYKMYGARGIKVCERWKSFEAFFEDMGPRPSLKHSIDRINNDGDYAPDNCRWATNHEQAANKGDNRILELDGVSKPLTVWARDLKIRHATLRERLDKMSVEEALTISKRTKRRITFNGLTMSTVQWASHIGIAHSTMRQRLRRLPIEIALDATTIRRR